MQQLRGEMGAACGIRQCFGWVVKDSSTSSGLLTVSRHAVQYRTIPKQLRENQHQQQSKAVISFRYIGGFSGGCHDNIIVLANGLLLPASIGPVRGHQFIGPGSNCRSSDRPLRTGDTGHLPIVYMSHSMVTASTYAPIPSVHRDAAYETLSYTPMAHADLTSLSPPELVSCIFQNQDPLLPVPSFTQIIYS